MAEQFKKGNGLNELCELHLPSGLYIQVDMHGCTVLHMTLGQLRQLEFSIHDYLTDYSDHARI